MIGLPGIIINHPIVLEPKLKRQCIHSRSMSYRNTFDTGYPTISSYT